ncbi:NADPH2:quinone reductase [Malonomonas rubra DSM 5091]|uniref:NADPH2:quinone reductase n=1 Tax=Malonomonas rubra DSM 5091 TaxID=1122189 RepID=A0A1M6NAA1_MALRU|nr:NADPH:quinone reductase [Malonomonas rubra]SHJ92619.1 NADPH2:quinone reductase [Malonomonas rubra DSM 5091]
MKAIRVHSFGDPQTMQLEDIQSQQPAGSQILIEVKAIGVNPVDTYIRAGVYPALPNLPYTPGKDAAGIIAAVGPDVKHHKVGDRVYCCDSVSGSYAEQTVCDQAHVFALPDNVDFTSGAAVGVPYSTAYFGLFYRAHTMPGETVLIHGASGSVGLAALQLAKANGIRAIGTAGSDEGLELIKQQGAIAALDHRVEGYLDAIEGLTCGQGVNVVLEMLANINLQKDLDALAKFGRVVVIGNRGTIEINPRATMGKNASIMGMAIVNATHKQLASMHSAIHAGLASGTLNPVISTELPLSKAAESHERVMQPGAKGKILLLP